MAGTIQVLRKVARRPTVSPSRVAAFMGLVSAFSIGLLIRLQMAKYGYYLDEFDSYFHYMSTSIIVNDLNTKGLSGLLDFFKVVNYQFWYPLGYNLATNTFAGFYYSSALLYEFVNRVLGVKISLYDYLVIQQAYIASFLAFPVYLIGKKIYNSTAGILAAMFAVITPGYLSRSDLGWYKHEPFSMLGGAFALYFLIASYDTVSKRKSLMYAMLCGLFLGYSNVSWGGGQYFNGIVGVSLFAVPLLLSSDYNRAINGVVITIVDLAVGMAFPNPGLSWLTNTSMFVLYAGSFGGLALTFIAKKLADRNKIIGKWIATLAFGGVAVAALLYGPFSHISARYLSVILPFARSIVPAVQTVAEQQPSSGVQILYYYLALLFFGIFGGYALLKRKKPYSIVVAILTISALYVASSFARLQVFTSEGIALVAGFGIAELSGRIFAISAPKLKNQGTSPVSVAKGFFAIMIIIMMIVSAMTVWVPFGNRGYAITSSALSNSNFYYPDWLQALSWISQNTPPNAKIISWWDYGYWISVMGNRTTFIDNGTLNSTRMAEVATMFLSNQTYGSKLVADMGGDYVVVFLTLRQVGNGYYTLGRVYNLGGDDGKIDAMATIAGINLTKSGLLNPLNLMPTRAFYANTTIGRMFDVNFTGYGVFDPSTGQLVSIYPDYQNSTTITQNYIQLPLFTLNQNYPTGSSPFEIVFNSNPSGAAYSSGVVAQVLIYKYNPLPTSSTITANSTNSSKG